MFKLTFLSNNFVPIGQKHWTSLSDKNWIKLANQRLLFLIWTNKNPALSSPPAQCLCVADRKRQFNINLIWHFLSGSRNSNKLSLNPNLLIEFRWNSCWYYSYSIISCWVFIVVWHWIAGRIIIPLFLLFRKQLLFEAESNVVWEWEGWFWENSRTEMFLLRVSPTLSNDCVTEVKIGR